MDDSIDKGSIAVIDPECVCIKCLERKDIQSIHINAMGWDSRFDGWGTKVDLCDECFKLTNPRWWDLKVIKGKSKGSGTYYEFENEILEFIENLSPAGRELFENRYPSNSESYWEPQDYIDYDLGILSPEKCEGYGLYTIEEKPPNIEFSSEDYEAYKEFYTYQVNDED